MHTFRPSSPFPLVYRWYLPAERTVLPTRVLVKLLKTTTLHKRLKRPILHTVQEPARRWVFNYFCAQSRRRHLPLGIFYVRRWSVANRTLSFPSPCLIGRDRRFPESSESVQFFSTMRLSIRSMCNPTKPPGIRLHSDEFGLDRPECRFISTIYL